MSAPGTPARGRNDPPPNFDEESALIRNEVIVTRQLTNEHRLIRFAVGKRWGLTRSVADYLRAIQPRYEPELIARWCAGGHVTVDGVAATYEQLIKTGQIVELRAALPPADPTFRVPPLTLLYEDEFLAVAAKNPGQLAHQAGKIMTGTLLNQLQDRIIARGGDANDVRLVNRIDRDTSGLVLISYRLDVHVTLSDALSVRGLGDRGIHKEYQALAHGVPTPAAGHWLEPLGPDDRPTVRRIVRADGQACDTEYQVEESTPADVAGASAFSRLRLTLHSGRQHQIRVHAAHHGCPLIGDWVYGSPCAELPGQALHAAVLAFTHPITGDALRVEAPLPTAFTALWARLRAGGTPTTLALNATQRSKLGMAET